MAADAASTFNRLLQSLVEAGARSPVVRLERASGSVIFEGAAGQARPDAARPMTVLTPFHLASVTKTMTATVVLQLAEEGAFGAHGLDATVADLGVFSPDVVARLSRIRGESHGARITLRHLLTHGSGMRDAMEDDAQTLGGPAPGALVTAHFAPGADSTRGWEPWDPARPDDAMAGVLNFYLNRGHADAALAAPGAAFHYSDTGYMVLGLAAEHASGQSLGQLFNQRVIAPLRLSHTYLAYRDDPKGLGRHRQSEAEVWLGDRAFLSKGANLSFDWAGGGLVSTASDLIVFLRALLEGRLFRRPDTLLDMTHWTAPPGMPPPRSGVGLGLDRTERDGIELIGRTGAWGARMARETGTGLFFAGTINQAAGPSDWHWAFIREAMGFA